MRADMQDLIIDCRRAQGYGNEATRRRVATRSAIARRDADDMPTQIRTRPSRDEKYQTDRLEPLTRWLHKNVGRPFDKIMSEFREVVDQRSLRGWHLALHLEYMVDLERGGYYSGFFADNNGNLQYKPYNRHRYVHKLTDGLVKLSDDEWQWTVPNGTFYVKTRKPCAIDIKYGPWPKSFGERPREFQRLVIVEYRQISKKERK